jgi:hypothetical protein
MVVNEALEVVSQYDSLNRTGVTYETLTQMQQTVNQRLEAWLLSSYVSSTAVSLAEPYSPHLLRQKFPCWSGLCLSGPRCWRMMRDLPRQVLCSNLPQRVGKM